MKTSNDIFEKYGEMLIAQQVAIFNLKYVIDNLTTNPKYYENNEEQLLRLIMRVKDNLSRVIADEI